MLCSPVEVFAMLHYSSLLTTLWPSPCRLAKEPTPLARRRSITQYTILYPSGSCVVILQVFVSSFFPQISQTYSSIEACFCNFFSFRFPGRGRQLFFCGRTNTLVAFGPTSAGWHKAQVFRLEVRQAEINVTTA